MSISPEELASNNANILKNKSPSETKNERTLTILINRHNGLKNDCIDAYYRLTKNIDFNFAGFAYHDTDDDDMHDKIDETGIDHEYISFNDSTNRQSMLPLDCFILGISSNGQSIDCVVGDDVSKSHEFKITDVDSSDSMIAVIRTIVNATKEL